jgi:hypothetical protein
MVNYLAPRTELDAVNDMLATILEAPVDSLEGELETPDVTLAKAVLGRVNREIQSIGWCFNKEYAYPLTKTIDNEFVLPSNAIEVVVNRQKHPTLNVVERDRKMYDIDNHTFKFENMDTLYVDIVFVLPFEDLPEAFRKYITIRACRIFQDKTLGSGDVHDYTKEDEMRARAEALNYHAKVSKKNLYEHIPSIVKRRSLGWV